MLRSLFTGISGLAAHQEMLDVTANNIANVNTTGFKSSTVQFEDTLSQTISGGGAGNATSTPQIGGTNPQQVGLGVQVAGTTLNFTQGSTQSTGVNTNMLINGDGFFVVQKNGQDYYTRNGAFTTDNANHIVLPDGSMLMEASGTATGAPTTPVTLPAGTSGYSIDNNGLLTAFDGNGNTVGTPIQIAMATFNNPNGLEKAGDSLYTAVPAAGAATYRTNPPAATGDGIGTVTTGAIEMSNVDLAKELTNLIIAERGFQANSKVITTSDQVLQTLVSMVQ